MPTQGIISNWRFKMQNLGLVGPVVKVQLSPRIARLRPPLAKVELTLQVDPQLLAQFKKPSPLLALFDVTLPKLEPMLIELGEEKAEEIIKSLCEHAQKMIAEHTEKGSENHLRTLFLDLPDYEGLIRQGETNRIIEVYRQRDFEGNTEGFATLLLRGKIEQVTEDEEGLLSIKLKNTATDDDLRILAGAPKIKSLDLEECTNITDEGLEYLQGLVKLQIRI